MRGSASAARARARLVALAIILEIGIPIRPAIAGQRIVSLAPSVTETVFALGAGGDLVGATDYCDWPAEARTVPRIGSYLAPSVEAVVARRPNLVIGVPTPGNRDAVQTLGDVGLRLLVVTEGPTLDDIFRSMEDIARAVGRDAEGAKLVASIRGRVDSIRARLAGAPPKRAVVVVGRRPLVLAGEGTLIDDLVRRAGAVNAATGLGPWPRAGLELLVRLDPEVVLDSAMGSEGAADLSFYEGLGLEAVRRGRIHAVRLDEVMRPGPRIAEGIEKLARILQPEAFR